jgi:hypothetical protein
MLNESRAVETCAQRHAVRGTGRPEELGGLRPFRLSSHPCRERRNGHRVVRIRCCIAHYAHANVQSRSILTRPRLAGRWEEEEARELRSPSLAEVATVCAA